MTGFFANIGGLAIKFFKENQSILLDFEYSNSIIKQVCGINDFFTAQEQATELFEKINGHSAIASEPDRRAYGDFQTNRLLAQQIVRHIASKANDFEFLLEPTCGKGNFLIASLKTFKALKKVVGVEIYQPYVWEAKFNILEHFLSEKSGPKPEIDIIHANAFEFDYDELAEQTQEMKTLIIGNPPWVTNSEQGAMDSKNLPKKSNFKKHRGLEAKTGKGNFDIGENISLTMLKNFHRHEGLFSFLIKNAVVKNLIQDQRKNKFRISQMEKLNIDSKKEFNVSVHACLFLARLANQVEYVCEEYDFYTGERLNRFGWYNDKFIYSIQDYDESKVIDGQSIFIWRSGVKHDCSKVMELEKENGKYINALGEKVCLEDDLVFGLLKSSDLKGNRVTSPRKWTLITQRKIGQETGYIKEKYPLTYSYLASHKEFFDKRKSFIYRNKPDFSIFGIGDYSFSPYKVGISGLYKSTHFTLIGPVDGKPLMLDDTCYFIGFNDLKMAEIAHFLVNAELVQKFLKSIIFSDSKRPINKEILMRIDFKSAFDNADFEKAKMKIEDLEMSHWEKFSDLISKEATEQMTLF